MAVPNMGPNFDEPDLAEMSASDLSKNAELILERIRSWPEPWAADLADFVGRKLEVAANRSKTAQESRKVRSERIRTAIADSARQVTSERSGLSARERTDLIRRRAETVLHLKPSRRVVVDVVRSLKRIDTFSTRTSQDLVHDLGTTNCST